MEQIKVRVEVPRNDPYVSISPITPMVGPMDRESLKLVVRKALIIALEQLDEQ